MKDVGKYVDGYDMCIKCGSHLVIQDLEETSWKSRTK